ncbi:Cullin [Trichoderma camerunense]
MGSSESKQLPSHAQAQTPEPLHSKTRACGSAANHSSQPNGPGGEGADFDACWNMIQEALRDIHNKSCGRLSFEELYRAAYKIVLKKKGEVLYDKVKEFEEQWFAMHVIPKIEVLVTKSLINIGIDNSSAASVNERRQTGEKFLKGLRDTWEDHNMSMNMTADILMYLDRGYTQQEPRRVPIFATTIALFRDHILRSCLNANSDSLIVDILISVMLDQIDMERRGDVIDRNLIRSCSRMLSCLYETEDETESSKLYLTIFEPRFLSNSETFYSRECDRLLRESDASTWLRHTETRLSEEEDRCGTTIERETLPKVSDVVDKKLILGHLDDFLAMEGSGLRWMIDNDKIDDLSILYRLISRVDDKKTALREILQKRVVELGLEIENVLKNTDFSTGQGEGEDGGDGDKAKTLNPAAQQTAAAIRWVDDVLRLKDKFDYMLEACFQDDLVLQTALTKSFADFINLFNRSSEYVSLFIDDSLKRGIRGKTEAEVDAILEKAIVLIRYLLDKDLFQTYYQRHLARRLLHGKSESHDVEKQIISRMKQEMGQQFTSKFEGMFRDLVTSSELTSTYRDHIRKLDPEGHTIDLNVNVLTTNYWPQEVMGRSAQLGETPRMGCTYPPEVKRLQASFEQFYLTNRNGRKLTWIGTTGSADIKCVFPAIEGKSGPLARERRYEMNVPTYGMVVLLLFNDLKDGESLSFEEIQAKTNMSTSDLTRALMAIAVAPKSRVLAKDPPTKNIKPTDRFSFNASFQSKTIRIKAPIINAVSKVEDKDERRTTEEKNNQTRAHIVDAAIVRIMKARRELNHSQLVSEVLSQLVGRFKPEVSLIKRRIEDLIVREYLERPDEDGAPSMYRYVA